MKPVDAERRIVRDADGNRFWAAHVPIRVAGPKGELAADIEIDDALFGGLNTKAAELCEPLLAAMVGRIPA